MSTAAIVETLAKEFSVDHERAQRVRDLLSSGLRVPTIARFRRAEVGDVADGTLRRFARRLRQLEELDKRRATLLRSIEAQHKQADQADLEASRADGSADMTRLEACMDRFELEDLFLPHRRPEPEVQLALDRGLGELADLLVADAPRKAGTKHEPKEAASEATDDEAVPTSEESAAGARTPEEEDEGTQPEVAAAPEPETAAASEPGDAAPTETEIAQPDPPRAADSAKRERAAPTGGAKEPYVHATHVEVSPQLARLCAPFVNTDRDIHNEEAALDGAMRILSDRLGRNPGLRGVLRRMMSKHGHLAVRPIADEKKLGIHRSLLKLNAPLRQLHGHKLLALRQAQAQRLIATSITVDEPLVLAKVRAALGRRIRPEYASVADVVAEQALRQRLLPMIEDDVRNDLRDRADEEAIRFLAQHLRQILFAPLAGARPVVGVHVDAKGDWLLVLVDRDGNPSGSEIRIEASGKEAAELVTPFGEALREIAPRAFAIGHGKGARDAVRKLRELIQVLQADAHVFLVNEAGLSSYANSEIARRELADWSVPSRHAISIARRFQDPLVELVKADMRHLGLGREQSVVSKANLRRVLQDTIESCVAQVGCDLNTAPIAFLRHVPGLNYEIAKKIAERRAERPFTSREELRTEGIMDDLTWTNAIGFLRIASATEPLDRTSLHPEQYDLARRVILDGGSSVDEAVGRRDALRGVNRGAFEVEEATWRDLLRQISHPGYDPRPRIFPPHLLQPDADPKALEKGQVVEGIISNVASFGAFVDLGIPRDGMIHISEISGRYVRDARVLLSIGQVVRARVLDSSGHRVELSLKNVPDQRRQPAPVRSRAARGRKPHGGEPQGRGQGGEKTWKEHQPPLRGARTRRDGLGGSAPTKERRPRQGAGGNRRGGPGGGRRRSGDEAYDPKAIREASTTASYNPFATFFKDKQEPEGVSEKGPDA